MIYCVEDERNIRELLVYTLETTGFEAEGFETGVEFDAAMKKSLPELILLDIMLPGEDGYNILKRLKSDTRTRDIPVIMVTAKEAEFDKVKGLEGGADDYITKPFSVRELIARVRKVRAHDLRREEKGEQKQRRREDADGRERVAQELAAGRIVLLAVLVAHERLRALGPDAPVGIDGDDRIHGSVPLTPRWGSSP